MSRARQYRRQAADYAQQSLLAAAHQRPMLRLLSQTWLELAAREDERARLDEPRSFAPAGAGGPPEAGAAGAAIEAAWAAI